MPLPVWLLPIAIKGAAVVAGAAGVGSAVSGAKKMKEANETIESANRRHERNMERFEEENKKTSISMDKLGKLELEILHSFSDFSDVFEKIQNRPEFKNYSKNGVELPKYDGETLKNVSVGAGVLLGGIGGAGLGAAGGFAAAGATSAAVMALGTASTGTAIASLSGAAATNATLAALGGGAVAAGGGGIAAGTAVLGAATLGVGLLIGGVIFNVTGSKISDKADEAWSQMKKAEKQIDSICVYLDELKGISDKYRSTLSAVNDIYLDYLNKLRNIVVYSNKTNWNTFSETEKKVTENTVLIVGLLYSMCKVELVLKSSSQEEHNKVNSIEVNRSISNARTLMDEEFGRVI